MDEWFSHIDSRSYDCFIYDGLDIRASSKYPRSLCDVNGVSGFYLCFTVIQSFPFGRKEIQGSGETLSLGHNSKCNF